jgi:hypothetical protein
LSPRIDAVYTATDAGVRGFVSNTGTPVSNKQNKARPKYNDYISLLISQYLISVRDTKI